MTTIDTRPDTAVDATTRPSDFGALSTVGAWIASTDHKRIGRLYIGTGLIALLGSLVVAVLLAFERIDAEGYQLLDAGAVTQLVSIERIGLLFGGIVPLVLGIAIAVVPLQIGSRSMAFPRLAAAGYWTWFSGLVLVVWSIAANGGPGGGDEQMVDLFLAGMVVLALGVVMAAVAVVTTVLTHRAPGMGLDRAPLLAWSALAGAVSILLVVPTLVGTLIYLYVDHRYGKVAFGGNVGILEWMGWALSQPTTYVLVLPVFGMLADTAPVAGRVRQPHRGGLILGIGLVSVGALGAVTQVWQHLPWQGEDFLDEAGTKAADLLPYALFNLVPLLGGTIVVLLALMAPKAGRPRPLPGFLFAMSGVLMVVTGIAGHALYSIDDAGLAGTVFEEGSFLYVVLGALLAAMGGIVHWGPKLWGRLIPVGAALSLALFGLLGVVLAALPLWIAGFADQPATIVDGFSYSGPSELWNILSLCGLGVLTVVLLAFLALMLRCFHAGELAGDDPWDGQTLEWATSSPPPTDNFGAVPVVASAEPLSDLKPSGSVA